MIDEKEKQRRINFGNKLRELRENKNLSKAFIARELNISQTSYWQYERGLREPSIKNLKLIAQMLEVSIDYLLFSTDDIEEFQEYNKKTWRAHGFLVETNNDKVIIGKPQQKFARELTQKEFAALTMDIYCTSQRAANNMFEMLANDSLKLKSVGNPILYKKFLHESLPANPEIPF